MSSSPRLIIDLPALRANYALLKQKAAPSETGAVVKANGYGLGLAPVAKTLYHAGCRTFFTAHLSEALALRKILQDTVIAPYHGVMPAEQTEAIAHHITPVLNSLPAIESWAQSARWQNKNLPAFVHLDTGMNRLGLPPDEQKRLIANPALLSGLEIKGWISHLACSEEFNKPMTTEQRDRFRDVLRQLPKAPASLCNSSGIFWGKDYLFDLVRPGVALYGVNPTPALPNPMRAVVELEAPVLQIRDVDTPMSVGYGASYRVTRKGRIATLALGYADGYSRALGNRGQVKIGDFLAPVVGRISMDLMTIDISGVPPAAVTIGAMATVIGTHRPVDQVAEEAGTIAYEILTSFGGRIEYTYKGAES